MSIGIYKIENLLNNKVYIGQSIHIERRWQEHCSKTSQSLISKAIQKYGKENFSFQIVEEVDDITLLTELETKYIKTFNSLVPNGYNVVLEDQSEKHNFYNYDLEIFKSIIADIKNNVLNFKQIAQKYELDLSTIYYLNRGDYHTIPGENYPLRQVKDLSKQNHYCIDCGIEIQKNALRCVKCGHLAQRKVERPSRDELKILIRTMPFTKIGEKFNVADNTIRKWCKTENLPFRAKDIKNYSDAEWKQI